MRLPRRNLKQAWRYLKAIPYHVSAWMRVSDAMRARDWPNAEKHLEGCFDDLELSIPSRDAIPKMNLAAIAASYWMNRPDRAFLALEATIDQLKSGRVGNSSEASYVARYCVEMAEFCAGRFASDETRFLKQAERAQALVTPFNLRRIREDYRSLFPLSDLPSS